MNLRILLPVLTVLVLTACTQTTVTLTPVPDLATPDAAVIQATPNATVPEQTAPDAILPTSTPAPTPTPQATTTIVPYPILLNTPTPIPAPTVVAVPAPTATPTRVPPPGAPSSPTPANGPTPTHPAPKSFKTPAPTPLRPQQDPARNENPKPGNPPLNGGSQQQPAFGGWLPPADCTGEAENFTSSPVDGENLWYLTPQGKLHGSHVTPTDHTYLTHNRLREYEEQASAFRSGGSPKPWVPPFDVKSPADGLIVRIGTFPFGPAPEGYTGTLEDYRVIIWHSCKVSTVFIHLAGLDPEILKVTGKLEGGSQGWAASYDAGAIPVKAGQVIGKVGAQGIDFSVHDTRVTLKGLLIPEHYQGEAWKIHTVDPFDYFEEPVRSQLLEKNPRKTAPYGGKIDYDIKGRLVGNWFMEGTVDYGGGGSTNQAIFCGTRPCPYWNGHLAIAYDHIDPQQVRISIGAETGIPQHLCNVCQGAYGVKGNGPDPASVDTGAGLIKYDLVAREFIDGAGIREPNRNADDQVLGVFLAQVMDDATIKVEILPGTNSSQVAGFSEKAKLYRR